MPKRHEIKDDLYSFIKTCWPDSEINSRKEALNKLCDILCAKTVGLASREGNKIVISTIEKESVGISLGSNTNNQSNAFLDSEDKGINTPKIREVLLNKLTNDGRDFIIIKSISNYFSEAEEFKVPSDNSEFIAYIRSNILENPDDWEDILNFANTVAVLEQTKIPYIKMALIFSLLCFPKEVNDENHYSRTDFFEALSPYFPSIEKKIVNVRELSEDNDTHGRIVYNKSGNIGRDNLLKEIEEHLRLGNHVALYGLGGIGKSYICRKIFWDHLDQYIDGIEYVAWINYNQDLESSIYNKFVKNKILKPDEYTKKDYWLSQFDYEPIIKEMYSQLNEYSNKARNGPNRILRESFNKLGKRFLMIIDNANSITSEEINWLNHCSFRIILTTRSKIEGVHSIHVDGPNIDYCCELYKIKAEKTADILSDEENSCIRKIIKLAGRHTLTIELIAKTQINSGISEKEMLEKLIKSGFSLTGINDTIENNSENMILIEHLSRVFNISDIGKDESKIRIMRYFSLLDPNLAIEARVIKAWFGLEDLNNINALIKLGWLNRGEGNYLIIHPVISDVVRYNFSTDYTYYEPLINAIISYFDSETNYNDFLINQKHYKSVVDRFSNINEDSYAKLLLLVIFSLYTTLQFEKAAEYCDTLLEMCKNEPIEKDDEKAGLELIKALRYECLKQFTKAIESYMAVLKLCENSLIFKANLYEKIAFDYSNLNDITKSLDYYTRSLMMYKEENEENCMRAGYCHLNIAQVLLMQNDFAEAKKHIDLGEKILSNENTDLARNIIDCIKGLYYYIQNDPQNAQIYLDRTFDTCSFFSMIPIYNSIFAQIRSEIYTENGNYNKAIELIEKSLVSSEEEQQIPPFQKVESYLNLADLYLKQENYEMFNANYNQAITIWKENIAHFNLADSFSKNSVILIVDLAQTMAIRNMDAQDYLNALNWYNSVEPILYPYYAEIAPERTIGLYMKIARLSYETGDKKKFIICLKKTIDLGEKYSLQDNGDVQNSKKIIENLRQGSLPSTSEAPQT